MLEVVSEWNISDPFLHIRVVLLSIYFVEYIKTYTLIA
jgi:hypothetical protein